MIDREALAAALDPAVRTYGWLKVLEEAAEERLAQLPKKCGTCADCPTCHGSGRVYPAALVTLIGEAFDRGTGSRASLAVAILDALNEVQT